MKRKKKTSYEENVNEDIIKKGKNVVKDFDDSQEIYVPVKRPVNKLISIRLPMKMIEDLRKAAVAKGDIGYQQIIKTYIADGLLRDGQQIGKQSFPRRPLYVVDNSGTSSNVSIIFPQKPKVMSGDYAKAS